MVHRSADSRLLVNLLQQEKDYSKQLGQVIESSNASLASFAAYAAASAPPTSHVIMDVAVVLAAADEALKSYARGVDEWREAMRVLKDAEEEVGNIMRDREILVTRLIKASKPSKSGAGNIRESLLLSNQRFPSSSSLSISVAGHAESPSPTPSRPLSSPFSSSTKLAAAQSELQACEAHLASKERELAAKRNSAIRDGMGARVRAMVDCGVAWTELGKNALHSLDELRVEQPEQRALPMQEIRGVPPVSNAGLSIPVLDSTRPSSDLSSIGPSQSVSQINGQHELPPPVSMAPVMNSVMFGAKQAGSNGEQTEANGQRPQSHQSSTTNSSIFSTPAVPTTYQVETVTYAPAIAVHVAGKEASTHPDETRDSFPLIPMPAPHALEGYVYDIPTATGPMAGPSGLQQSHSRSNSGHSTPQGATLKPALLTRHVLERRITEDSQEDKRRNSEAHSDDVSSFEEVKQENKLLEEGKLAMVENPRFLSEARRQEIEKEREKARREEAERMRKEKGKEHEAADDSTVHDHRERRLFSLFHSSKHERDHPQETRTVAATVSPGERSPSKGFLGSLRCLFGAKSPAASPAQHPARAEDDDSDHHADSDTEVSPSKRGLHSLFRPADKSKTASPPGRWETRTDKNIRTLARRGSYDGELAKPAPNRYDGGIAGAAVAQAGIVTAPGIGRRTRAASVDVTSASRTEPPSVGPAHAAAGRRLKKHRGGPPSSAVGGVVDSTSNMLGASSPTPTQRNVSASVRPPADVSATKNGHRRSASVDPSENRKSWAEQSEGEGDGMIVDLGRRRRVASEVGGTKTPVPSAKRGPQTVIASSSTNTARPAAEVPKTSRSAFVERTADVFGPTQTAKGYSSDTAAAQPTTTGVTKKKSLSKKRRQDATIPPVPLQPTSPPASSVSRAHTVPTPTRKTSTKAPPPTTVSATAPSAHQTGATTVLTAGAIHPSGVLVPQPGWNAQAQAQGGGLSRNSSAVSAASAPAGGATRTKKKATTLGQGMGGSGGVARRGSLTSAPSPTKFEPPSSGAAPVFQPLPPATSLMSIVEDVARANREGWQQDLKMRKSAGGSQKPSGMIDVVKAPPLMERTTLEALGATQVRHRAAGSTTTVATDTTVTPSRTGMFEIKAPGSVFDQRKADIDSSRAKPQSFAAQTPRQEQRVGSKPTGTAESALHSNKVPLRSALRNSSRSPSPIGGPSYTARTVNEPAHESHAPPPPPPIDGVLPWGRDGTLHQQRQTDKGKARAPPAPEEVEPSGDDSSEVFYSDVEEFERKNGGAAKAAPAPPAQPEPKVEASKLPPLTGMNGHAINGHPGRTASEISHSSTSTFVAGSAIRAGLPPTEHADTPRRRKSVRVSLQPTFSPSPPAIEDYEEQEQRLYEPWASQEGRARSREHGTLLPAPVAVRAPPKQAVSEQLDMWADSDDEDEQYTRAKRMLSRAAKKEKDVSLMVSNRVY